MNIGWKTGQKGLIIIIGNKCIYKDIFIKSLFCTVSVVCQQFNMRLNNFLLQQNGWAAIHYASREGYTNIVEVLINHYADINIVTKVTQLMRMSIFIINFKVCKLIDSNS